MVDSDETSHDLAKLSNTSNLATLPDTSNEIIYLERELDPLFPSRQFKEAAEQKFVLTSNQLRQIIGINSKSAEFTRFGLKIKKVGCEGNQNIWKMSARDTGFSTTKLRLNEP